MRDQATSTFGASWYALQIASMQRSENRLAALPHREQGLTEADLEAIWDGRCALSQKIAEYRGELAARSCAAERKEAA